jgi:hypothetical protein
VSNSDDRARGRERRAARPRREPLFPLEADDIAPRSRQLPPSPLGDLLSDIDATLPTRAAPPSPPRGAPTSTARPARPRPPDNHAGPPPRREASTPPPQSRPTATREREAGPQLRIAPSSRDEEELYAAYERVNSTAVYLARAEQLHNQQLPLGVGRLAAPPTFLLSGWILVGLIIIVSLTIIVTLLGGRNGGVLMSGWVPQLLGGEPPAARATLFGPVRPTGDYTLRAPPSLSPEQIDRILASYGSPAAGTGQIWYNLGLERGIDPAFAVAFFIHESAAGTAQAWAGLKPDGSTTHNVGNIICAGYATCYGRFRDYPSWEVGIADWYRLIDVEYLQGRGHQTVADIIPVYAPSFENDVNGYVHVVQRLVDQWRAQGVP